MMYIKQKGEIIRNIREVPIEFIRDGIKDGYKQNLIKRYGKYVIYDLKDTETGLLCGYELHIIRKKKPSKSNKEIAKFIEYLANDEEFGEFGWFFGSIESLKNFIISEKIDFKFE